MTIDEYAKEKGYFPVSLIGNWNGYKVYEPDIYTKSDETIYIGYPLVILEKDNRFRISTTEESLDILKYFDNEE